MIRATLAAQPVKNPPAMQETLVRSLGWEDLEKGTVRSPVSLGFSSGSESKESSCSAGDLGSIPGLGRSPEGGHVNPLHVLENPHGQRNLAGYSPWGHKELDTAEATWQTCIHPQLETLPWLLRSSFGFVPRCRFRLCYTRG